MKECQQLNYILRKLNTPPIGTHDPLTLRNELNISFDESQSLFNILVKKGRIRETTWITAEYSAYIITDEGSDFIRESDHCKEEEEELIRKKEAEDFRRLEREEMESNIRNNELNKKLFRWNIAFGVLNLIGIIFNVWQAFSK
jgi:predicted transcriptional regulator